MPLPPWTVELLRRGISDVAKKAQQPETIEKIKSQATEILNELPKTAARGIDAVMRSAEAGQKSVARWARRQTSLAVPMLNATGVLMTDHGSGVPLADPIVDIGCALMSGNQISGAAIDDRLAKQLAKIYPETGSFSFAITTNFDAAIATIAVLGQERRLVVHRAHAVRLPSGTPLPTALTALAGVNVTEVGSSNHASQYDFEGFDDFIAVLADGGEKPVELFEFTKANLLQAVLLPVATINSSEHEQIPSAQAILSGGADLVVLPGQGLCGVPNCGILIGRKDLIERIQHSETWKVVAADAATQAMLTIALEMEGSKSTPSPIHALLQTSEENLRGRAERLAGRLSGDDAIVSCHVTADDARLTQDGRWRFPSRQICVRHRHRSAESWAEELRKETPAIFASVAGEEVKFDLRWIPASKDGKLAEKLGSPNDVVVAVGAEAKRT